MAAPKGNRFWEARTRHGRDLILESPEKLWESCCEYFQWVEEHPLWEEKLFAYQGEVTRGTAYKMRAMTIGGLCMFLNIDQQTWANYRAREDFFGVVSRAEEVIRQQKFEGAAAELLNPNIIARDLGLRDKREETTRTADDDPWLALQREIFEHGTQSTQDVINPDDDAP